VRASLCIVLLQFASAGCSLFNPLVLAEQLDDTGKPIVVSVEPRGIVAIAALGLDLYWITATGELRRRRSASTDVTAILRGLSADTTMIVSASGVVIGDRGRNQVLHLEP